MVVMGLKMQVSCIDSRCLGTPHCPMHWPWAIGVSPCPTVYMTLQVAPNTHRIFRKLCQEFATDSRAIRLGSGSKAITLWEWLENPLLELSRQTAGVQVRFFLYSRGAVLGGVTPLFTPIRNKIS